MTSEMRDVAVLSMIASPMPWKPQNGNTSHLTPGSLSKNSNGVEVAMIMTMATSIDKNLFFSFYVIGYYKNKLNNSDIT